ncbi:MAG: Uncharacterised protein [Methanobacteriota archaeon]|nr:hypothetical protein [Euryarchaeota archaeon]CAI8232781.1 MAG: Uncharacterised protein [Euryarchaeota archaeon]
MSQRQRGILLVLALLLSSIGVASAQNGTGPHTSIEELEPMNGIHFIAGEEVEFKIQAVNSDSIAHSIEYNPTCPYTFQIVDSMGSVVYDLEAERLCPVQKRGETLDSGEILEVGTVRYDFTSNGDDLATGTYEILAQFGEDVEVARQIIDIQQKTQLPTDVRMEAIVLPFTSGDVSESSDHLVISAIIHNDGTEAVSIEGYDDCDILWSLDGDTPMEAGIGCGEGITINAGDSHHLGWIEQPLNDAVVSGPRSASVWIIGNDLSAQIFNWAHTVSESTLTDVEISIESHSLSDSIAPTASDIDVRVVAKNMGPAKIILEYSADCAAPLSVLDERGLWMHDQYEAANCDSPLTTLNLLPGEETILWADQVSTVDTNGCGWIGSNMAIQANLPQIGQSSIRYFELLDGSGAQECRASNQPIDDIVFSVEEFEVVEDLVRFDLALTNNGELPVDFILSSDCAIRSESSLQGDDQSPRSSALACELDDSMIRLSEGDTFIFEGLSHTLSNGVSGQHTILFTLQSVPEIQTSMTFTIEDSEEAGEENAELDDDGEIIVVEEETILSVDVIEGTWSRVRTNDGGCWILTSPAGEERALEMSNDASFAAIDGEQGVYRTVEAALTTQSHCIAWGPGFVIEEVLSQWAPADKSTSTDMESEDSESAPFIQQITAPATTVVVTTSLLSIVLLFIVNTEWIRIGLLNGGLALIGMVRRRDYDGDFQRGRVVGYLVANPGVHFRALLAALDMSNGQLAHHLKVLEETEMIWRRRDGRMMRYYPSTIDSKLDENDLPVPLLSPDPNSLQGRILDLLDATGNDIVNLSQKELAVRLESSQQLISHHLKTLEAYGLIERDRVGMRFRYRLTREALFLLESADLDA